LVETAGAKARRFTISLLLDKRPVLGDILEGLQDRLQRNLVIPREVLGGAGIRTVDGLVNDRGADAATLEKELAIVGSGPRLEVLIRCRGVGRHGSSIESQRHSTMDQLRPTQRQPLQSAGRR
jgi:hypothetical protein